MLQRPPPEKVTHSQSIADTAKKCLSAGLLDGGFLDFLYPAKTLSLIHKLAIRDVKQLNHRACRSPNQTAIRSFTSEAVEDRVATDSDMDHAMSLLSTLHENSVPQTVQKSNPLEKYQITTKGEFNTTRNLANLRADYKKAKTEYDQAWQRYHKLETSGDTPKETLLNVLKHVKTLGLELLAEASRQILNAFTMIPVEARNEYHYEVASEASLILCDIDSAMHIQSEAQGRGPESVRITQRLMHYVVLHKNIEAGARLLATWEKQNFQAHLSIFDSLNYLTPKDIIKRAKTVGQEVLHRISSKDSGTDTNNIRNFAIKIMLRSLDRPGATEYFTKYPAIFKVLCNLLKLSPELLKFSPQLPILAIDRFLASRKYKIRIQAVQIYEDFRDCLDTVQRKELMHRLIKHFSLVNDDHHVRMVFEDYQKHYGLPTRELFAITIRQMSYQGDAIAFHKLFQEYRDNFGNPTDPRIYQQLLYVHSRRLEVNEVVENFNSLEKVFGFVPNVDCWNTVIAAHARVSDAVGALKWYEKLGESEVKPNATTISTLINMLASGGDVDAIESLIQDCEQQGLRLSTYMIDGLVLAHIKNGDQEEAEKIVDEAMKMDLVGSRTHMWNYILNSAALQRNLSKLHYLHQRMEEADIPSNAMTYGALMQGLCVQGIPQSAERILYRILPKRGIRATAFHYAAVMGGHLNVGNYQRIFHTYRNMLNNNIKPNFSTQNLLLKAAAHLDIEDNAAQSDGNANSTYCRRAEELLAQVIESADASDVALPEPLKGVGTQRLDEALVSSIFDYLIYLYAQSGALDKIPVLYAQYLETSKRLRPDAPIDLPIKMLAALMVSHRKLNQHDEVEKCWYLALQSAEPLARRTGASLAEPGWVLHARRFILNMPLVHYMKSLVFQDRAGDIPDVVAELLSAGYALSNKAWNLYVQALAQGGYPQLAFEAAEKELMPNWQGWDRKTPNRDRMPSRLRNHLKPEQCYPNYRTLMRLTKTYMEMRNRYVLAGLSSPLHKLHVKAPKVVKAVVDMPRSRHRKTSRVSEGGFTETV